MSTYLDFDLRISGRDGSDYVAEVLDSPAGRSHRRPVKLPFDDQDLPRILLQLENAVLRGTRSVRGGFTSRNEKTLRDFGEGLFQAVFNEPEIRAKYESSLIKVQEAREQTGLGKNDGGLRIRLQIDPPELAALPWEYLYDSQKAQYINLAPTTPMVRYLEVHQPESKLTVEGPLRVLGMISNPGGPDWESLDTEKERRVIDDAVGDLEEQGLVQFEWVPGESWRHLIDKMREGPWHVFHFIGHGGIEEDEQGNLGGFVVMVDDHGRPRHIHTDKLKVLLSGTQSLRLVVLNCCEGAKGSPEDAFASPGAGLVRSGIPVVVAMQFPIGDNAAIEFASSFYTALSENCPVHAALTRSRQHMYMESDVEWGIPILFTRASRGQLFSLKNAAVEELPDLVKLVQGTTAQTRTKPQGPETNDHSEAAPVVDEARQELARKHVARSQELLNSDPEEAIEQLNRAIDILGGTADMLARRADLYGRLQLFTNALADIDAAIAIAPRDSALHFLKGVLHTLAAGQDGHLQDDQSLAVAAFTEAIALDPDNARYHNARGAAYSRAERYDEALADLTRAVELAPDRADYFRHRGVVQSKRGSLAEATNDLERSSRLGDTQANEELAKRRFQDLFNRNTGEH